MIAEFLVSSAVGRAFTFGVLALMIYTPFCLSIGVEKMVYGKSIPGSRYWQSFIPAWNMIKADIQYFGKPHLATWSLLGLLGLPIRILAVFISTESPMLYYITFGLMVIGIVFYFIANIYTSFVIINDAQVMKTWQAIMLSIVFPFGYMYIGNILAAEINRRQNTMDNRKGF